MKFLREPLLHFLLIGAALFVLFDLAGKPSQAEQERRIVVSAGRIQQMASIFAKTWQRPPTANELKGLIDDFVLEEIYYRQAVAMGIDRDDTVIRRRMRQKFEFLTDDLAAVAPTEEELSAYLVANPDAFRRETTYTFDQVYINSDSAAEDLEELVADRLAALRSGDVVPVETGLLPTHFNAAPARVVDNSFGTGFSGNLDALTPGEWLGPVESGLGVHLVRLESRVEGTLPELEAIRPVVEREWANEKRLGTRRLINEQLLKDYEIEIDWPRTRPIEAP